MCYTCSYTLILLLDHNRSGFFYTCLQKVAASSKAGYDALQKTCKSVQMQTNLLYPDVPINSTRVKAQHDNIHEYSAKIIPAPYKSVCTPLKSTGDGNCLYRYICRILCTRIMIKLHPRYLRPFHTSLEI